MTLLLYYVIVDNLFLIDFILEDKQRVFIFESIVFIITRWTVSDNNYTILLICSIDKNWSIKKMDIGLLWFSENVKFVIS